MRTRLMQTYKDEYGFVWIRHIKRKKPKDRVVYYDIAMEEPYLFETFTYMRERESRLKKFRGRSPQKRHRRILVDWICTSGEESDFPKSTVNLAIIILDRFMDSHSIESMYLHFVCLACLSVSAKFDMKETKALKFSNMRKFLPEKKREDLSPADFRELEYKVMAAFDWNIYIFSPTHFVEPLEDLVLRPSEIYDGTKLRKNTEFYHSALNSLKEFMYYFIDIAMQVK